MQLAGTFCVIAKGPKQSLRGLMEIDPHVKPCKVPHEQLVQPRVSLAPEKALSLVE
jgi:hypothetical protein